MRLARPRVIRVFKGDSKIGAYALGYVRARRDGEERTQATLRSNAIARDNHPADLAVVMLVTAG